MRIRCKNPSTAMLYDPTYMDKPIRFRKGLATVSEEVGRKMIKQYGPVEEVRFKTSKRTYKQTVKTKGVETSEEDTNTEIKEGDDNVRDGA